MSPTHQPTRRDAIAGGMGLATLAMVTSDAQSGPALPTGTVNDFDFLVGSWKVLNKRLAKRWVGSQEWQEFPATFHCLQYLGGILNVDEMQVPSKNFAGTTIRAFDLQQRRWAIYWVNNQTGVLQPPVFGGFNGDVGHFYGEDADGDKAVRVHFTWMRLGADSARWQQVFSLDGKNWETNWIMEFTRA
jgi:hypothetical protein